MLGLGADKVTNSGARPMIPCHLRVIRDDINAAAMVIANDLSGTVGNNLDILIHLDPIPHPWRLQQSAELPICNLTSRSGVQQCSGFHVSDEANAKSIGRLGLFQNLDAAFTGSRTSLWLNAATHQCMDVQYLSNSKLVPSYIFHDTFIGCHFCWSLEFHQRLQQAFKISDHHSVWMESIRHEGAQTIFANQTTSDEVSPEKYQQLKNTTI